MRIAWCTPFGPDSAIGRFSEHVVRTLDRRDGCTVDLWYPPEGGLRETDLVAHRLPMDDVAAVAALRDYDHVVYNLGNHAGNHGRILELSAQLPGVVVLHDVSLIHLVYEKLLAQGPDTFRHFMSRWYGRDGEVAAEDALGDAGGWPWADGTVETYPMLAPALAGAQAVITHSSWAATRVRWEFLGEVVVARLPLEAEAPPADDGSLSWLDPDKVVILQAGAINPDKRVGAVVEGFARARLDDRAQLVVCGHSTPGAIREVRELARVLDVTDAVTVLGKVSDAMLAALRARADVATVLRHPSSEAASAVLVDSMNAGTAVVTVDSGCYAEVDADTVVHLPVPPVADDVGHALATLVDDPARRAELKEAGRRHVALHHTAEAYADTVLTVLSSAGAAGRRRLLAEDLGHLVRSLHADADGDLVHVLAETAAELFGPTPRVLGPYAG